MPKLPAGTSRVGLTLKLTLGGMGTAVTVALWVSVCPFPVLAKNEMVAEPAAVLAGVVTVILITSHSCGLRRNAASAESLMRCGSIEV